MKKIKLTAMDIFNMTNGLAELSRLVLPMDICYKFAKLQAQLLKEQELIEKIKADQRKAYITDEDIEEVGRIQEKKKTTVVLTEDELNFLEEYEKKRKLFQKEFGKFLMEQEVEVVIDKYIDLSDPRVKDIKFETRHLTPLIKFFTVKVDKSSN